MSTLNWDKATHLDKPRTKKQVARVTEDSQPEPARTAAVFTPVKSNTWTGPDIVLGTVCVIAVIVCVFGIGMALVPGSSSPYLSDTQVVRDAARIVRGQYLSILGAIIASGAGVVLTLRARLAG